MTRYEDVLEVCDKQGDTHSARCTLTIDDDGHTTLTVFHDQRCLCASCDSEAEEIPIYDMEAQAIMDQLVPPSLTDEEMAQYHAEEAADARRDNHTERRPV